MNDNDWSTLHRSPRRGWLAALALVFLLPACAPAEDDATIDDSDLGEPVAEVPDDRTDTRGEPLAEGASSARLVVVSSETLGEYVSLDDGTPVYLFTSDVQGEASACYDDCADAWPPVMGSATAGANLDSRLLGTITRDDGGQQVTYNGWPLYRFARDTGTEPTGQDMSGFGGEWYLVTPGGAEVHAESGNETGTER